VGAVTVSAIVALTLSPMMSSRMLKHIGPEDRGVQAWLVHFIDRRFNGLRNWYARRLNGSLNIVPVTVLFAIVILGSIYFLYQGSKKELAPEEDQGFLIAYNTPAPNATLTQKLLYSKQLYGIVSKYPELFHMFQIDSPAVSIGGLVLKPWSQRTSVKQRAQYIRQLVLQGDLFKLAGIKSVAVAPPPLPTSFGYPLEFVIGTTEPFGPLNEVATKFTQEALKSGKFFFLDDDLKIDQPQVSVEIDRDKVAQLGLHMSDVGNALSAMLGGNYVNYFSLAGRSYKVIPQVSQQFRFNTQQLDNYYIKSADGTTLPLSTVAHLVQSTVPESLNHFQQLNAATLKGVPAPGVSLGEANAYLQDLAARTLPQGYSIDYSGPLREFVQESGGFITTFGFALIIIFLALAAQFESFRDPLIILVSVPMSIAGALMFIDALNIGDFIAFNTGMPIFGASINIYTEVGLVTLMGLVSKHGILIVQFANDLQRAGRTKRQAIEEAAAIRLRPILMTTFAMVLGVFPLLGASGAGAVSRFNMGLVIASGLAIGTLFTLFVVPAAYLILAGDHHRHAGDEADLPALPNPAATDRAPQHVPAE
jgi:multidrug efflux pump